jgi:putative transcriptional regulator
MMSDQLPPENFTALTGCFLIAETDLGDPNFVETVVLIISHDSEGAFGLVVNRKSDVSLGDAAPKYHDSALAGLPLYIGGPVEQEYLFTIHSGLPSGFGSNFAHEVVKGVIFEPNFAELERFILNETDKSPPQLRLFAGYSGWGPGQLEGEMSAGSWVTIPAEAEMVFSSNPAAGWKAALRKKGGVYWVAAETGYKPSLN